MNSTRHRCSLLLLPILASFADGNTVSAAARVVSDLPELVFQSGFEGTCEIVPLGTSQHGVIGKDTTLREKNDWVEDMEQQAGVKTFRFDYTGGDISQRFVRIVPEPGNPTNKVLWFWLNDSWKADGGVVKARVQADWRIPSGRSLPFARGTRCQTRRSPRLLRYDA